MSGLANRGRFYAWAGVAVLSAYCLFVAGAWQATYYAEFRIWALIPAFAVVAAWIAIAFREPFWLPRTVLAPAFAAAFLAFTISTITSRFPRLSVEYLALAALLTALYLILQRLMASPFFRDRMIGFGTIAGILVGLAYIAVTVPHWVRWWGFIGHLAAPPLRPAFESLTFGNPSAVMTASVLLTAPAVAYLTGGSRRGWVASSALVALSGIVTLISGSRAGWLAIGIAVVVVGALWLVAPERRVALLDATRARAVRIAIVPAVIAAAAVAVVVAPGLIFRATAGGEGLRTVYYAAAIRMFQSSPLVGTGPGTWVPQRINYTLPGETDYYIPHAHNIYLQVLAEFGLVGFLAGIVVAVVLGRLLFGAIRDADPRRRRMGWAALFATVYFAAHQLLDVYANAPSILFAFVIPIAWLDATAPAGAAAWSRTRWGRTIPEQLRKTVLPLGVAAMVGSAGFLAWSESGAALLRDGTFLLNDRDATAAIAPLTAAVDRDPAMPPYHLALGLALANTGDLAGAEEQFLANATMDGLPEAWLNLAAVRARSGDAVRASEALAEAMRLGNQQTALTMGAGAIELELGQGDAAVKWFAASLLLNPTLAGDPWWTADRSRTEIWPEVYRLAFDAANPDSQFQLALETGDSAAAETAIDAIADADLATTNRLVLSAWGGDSEALSLLEQRARDRPLDTTVVNWCARLLRRSGDEETARLYARWADTINGDASVGGYEIRVMTDREPHVVAGINTLFYGHYTYRRPVPGYQLVDWLPELTYE